jgi:cytochrome c-type biogenesis protein
MENISILTSFTAGLLSFFSPCVFPLLLVYLSVITGLTVQDLQNNKELDRFYIFVRVLFFVLGFTVVFVCLGIFAKYIAFFLFKNKKILNLIVGIILILLSVNLLGLLKLKFLQQEKRFSMDIKTNGKIIWSFILGIVFAAGWTPCIGPILGSILTMASREENVRTAVYLLLLYSFGLAIPFLLVGFFYNVFLAKLKYLNKYLLIIQKIIGVIILVLGILIINGKIL